jgi:hypothetical protein
MSCRVRGGFCQNPYRPTLLDIGKPGKRLPAGAADAASAENASTGKNPNAIFPNHPIW